jgi:hypothetical protein
VAPLRGAVPLLADTLGELPFTQSATIFNDPTQPHPYTGTNTMLSVLSLVNGTDVPGSLHRRLMDAVAPWTLGRAPNFRFGEQAARDWPLATTV